MKGIIQFDYKRIFLYLLKCYVHWLPDAFDSFQTMVCLRRTLMAYSSPVVFFFARMTEPNEPREMGLIISKSLIDGCVVEIRVGDEGGSRGGERDDPLRGELREGEEG